MKLALPKTSLHVLLVEDNPDHTLLIRRAIQELDSQHGVETIEDAERVLAHLRAARQLPDLILLDINMPGYSGFDVLTRLRQDEQLKRIPVVMLTSSEAGADIARAYELGASGYISKPSHFQDLRAVLGNTMLYWSAMQRHQPDGGDPGGPS
jgi:CheY-like chemotaxis protein